MRLLLLVRLLSRIHGLFHLVNLLVLVFVELDALLEDGDVAEVGHAELVGVALLGDLRLLRRGWRRWLLRWRGWLL